MIVKTFQGETEKKPTIICPNTKSPITVDQCLFLDIETVSGYKSYEEMPSNLQECWRTKAENWISFRDSERAKKSKQLEKKIKSKNITSVDELDFVEDADYASLYKEKSGLFPEYAKVVCISVSFFNRKNEMESYSFVGEERDLLLTFANFVQKINDYVYKERKKDLWIVGHNILLFDIPFLFKRFVINGLYCPSFLHKPMEKAWNKRVIDTRDVWRADDKNGDNTLHTICTVLGIPTPKDDITGKMMTEYWYSENCDINRIVEYCEKDTIAVYRLFEHFQNLEKI